MTSLTDALSSGLSAIQAGQTAMSVIGQNLANAQRVCVTGLIPSGTRPNTGRSPENVVAWMTYVTRSGPVEIGKLLGSDGQYSATVKAAGIWDVNQQPLVQQFTLPTQSGNT